MRRIMKYCLAVIMIVILFDFGGLLADKRTLRETVLRVRIAADSNIKNAQWTEHNVEEAILNSTDFCDLVEQKDRNYSESLAYVEKTLNRNMSRLGLGCKLELHILKMRFDTVEYSSVKLPAGIYDTLNVTIGDGKGAAFDCVIYPFTCTDEINVDSIYFDQTMIDTLTGSRKLRFFLLDGIGQIENILF